MSGATVDADILAALERALAAARLLNRPIPLVSPQQTERALVENLACIAGLSVEDLARLVRGCVPTQEGPWPSAS